MFHLTLHVTFLNFFQIYQNKISHLPSGQKAVSVTVKGFSLPGVIGQPRELMQHPKRELADSKCGGDSLPTRSSCLPPCRLLQLPFILSCLAFTLLLSSTVELTGLSRTTWQSTLPTFAGGLALLLQRIKNVFHFFLVCDLEKQNKPFPNQSLCLL